MRPFTEVLLDQQLAQFGQVLRAGTHSPLWTSSLAPLTLSVRPLVSHYLRRVGRPKREWVPIVLREAHLRNNGHLELQQLAVDKTEWSQVMVKRAPAQI